jgi:hypothetical protein
MPNHASTLLLIAGLLLPECAGLSAAPASAGDVAAEQPVQNVRLADLARQVAAMPELQRSDFAWIAISEMASAYTGAAARAREEVRHGQSARDRLSWARAVDQYAGELAKLAASIAPDTPVSIRVPDGSTIHLQVAGRPVIVGFPQYREQALIETRVIEGFCKMHDCADMQVAVTGQPQPGRAGASGVRWSFSQHAGPSCVVDGGLEFQFRDMSNIAQKKALCTRIVAELDQLAARLEWQESLGLHIDWNALVIGPQQNDAGHRVILNAGGADSYMPLPMLAERTAFFRSVRPWLAARAGGNSYPFVIINAERLLELPGNGD